MDILRGKSADVVRKEIYMHLLVYNLIRVLMWQASEAHGQPLHRLSFAGTLQRVNVVLPYLWLFSSLAVFGNPKGRNTLSILTKLDFS